MSNSMIFPFILTVLVIFTGLVSLIDIMVFAKKRKMNGRKQSKMAEYSRSFFPVLLLVWVVRSFLVQPYRVPTGSLEPTIMPGDFIAVNQFSYGLRLPVINYKFISTWEPKRGDIALFQWPKNPSIVFVKRVIGVPGDHIVYKNKTLTINGKVAAQKTIGKTLDYEPGQEPIPAYIKTENLLGVEHKILQWTNGGETGDFDITVPKGEYFMMGDNRDDSDDSRTWGFVPEKNLIGKAFIIWMSWDSDAHKIRWHRIGNRIV